MPPRLPLRLSTSSPRFLTRHEPAPRTLRYASSITTTSSSPKPRHLLSISNLTPQELRILINNAVTHRQRSHRSQLLQPLRSALQNQTIALLFSKRSTRTRVSSESAIAMLSGHPLFLGSADIQLGVNESLRDTGIIISSMTSGMIARVGPHSDIVGLAEYSSVPVINALCDTYHPMQIVADFATLASHLPGKLSGRKAEHLAGVKVAWVGDANNVLFDMCVAAAKLGMQMSVATPKGYEIPERIKAEIQNAAEDAGQTFALQETNAPEEAVKNADVIVTDTWISMGQEAEKNSRLKAFTGYQVTEEMARRGGAKKDWRFMHCLPRHPEEVDDDVFYGPRSLVFPEGENRLWSAVSVLEGFVVNKGDIRETE